MEDSSIVVIGRMERHAAAPPIHSINIFRKDYPTHIVEEMERQ